MTDSPRKRDAYKGTHRGSLRISRDRRENSIDGSGKFIDGSGKSGDGRRKTRKHRYLSSRRDGRSCHGQHAGRNVPGGRQHTGKKSGRPSAK